LTLNHRHLQQRVQVNTIFFGAVRLNQQPLVVGSTQWLEEKDAPTSTARKAQSKKAPRLDMTKAAQISNTTPPSLGGFLL